MRSLKKDELGTAAHPQSIVGVTDTEGYIHTYVCIYKLHIYIRHTYIYIDTERERERERESESESERESERERERGRLYVYILTYIYIYMYVDIASYQRYNPTVTGWQNPRHDE